MALEAYYDTEPNTWNVRKEFKYTTLTTWEYEQMQKEVKPKADYTEAITAVSIAIVLMAILIILKLKKRR